MNQPTVLYRFLAANGRLLYIGITGDPASRWRQHASTQPWWHEVTDIRVEWLPSRETAAAAEVKAITAERPLYNKMHSALCPHESADRSRWVPPRDAPCSIEAEQRILGAMLLSATAAAEVVTIVGVDDFWRPAHQALFEAVLAVYATDAPVDPMAVAVELAERDDVARVGGLPYLRRLIARAGAVGKLAKDAQLVRELAARRRLIGEGLRLVHLGYAPELAEEG